MSAITYGWKKDGGGADSFWVKFAPCSREPRSWKEEVYEAARVITNSTTKPLYLCFSGGIDSELMCQAFFDQGIQFSVITVEHSAGTNLHDITYAKEWCRRHNVEQKIVYFDMERFLTEEVPALAGEEYATRNVFRFFQIKLMQEVERLGGYAVFGGGEQLYRIDEKNPAVHINFETGYSVPLEWCRRNNTRHEPYFYFSTPELCLSYLRIPLVATTTKDVDVFRHNRNAFLFKRLVYQTYWPTLEARKKYSGYENIYPLREQAQKGLEKKFGSRIQTYSLPVSEMIEQLSPQI